ncbi:TROVE domain-containing protein [Pelagicoccus sp. SDUM812003]|uniref:TROVE domain-containing protein n=1 Tax=Pelagicoccus sp. SDUM812003 TaxID=3041267 RepID=UPI00280D38B0|nr:TROVE domain-containing protein [Pelagicoccus sp. SDUM812003]MDQ8205665.1 TROVE domain-containing protein [Pelagicoccus sp. SDUM812003]
MANKTLFQTLRGALIPSADAVNEAGGVAYQRSAKQALAQYVATGCLNGSFYASAGEQLDQVIELCKDVENGYIARLAIYARRSAYMKDTPALLCAILSGRDSELFDRVAFEVLDNAKMIRTFVQIMRSGVVGRKSLGTRPKRVIQEWLFNQSDDQLFRASVGQSPSIADIIKMVHPRPKDDARAALYAYLIGREYDADSLPSLAAEYEAFKEKALSGPNPPALKKAIRMHRKSKDEAFAKDVPDVPFQMLTALPIGFAEWATIARNAPWQMTRMNLNTFQRHGLFECSEIVDMVAERLRDPKLVRKSRVFPYQLLAAYKAADSTIPAKIKNALQDALEVSVENVPSIAGKVVVCPDSSGSMGAPVTGYRRGSSSSVTCVDVAALVAAAFLRKNRNAQVLPFMERVIDVDLNARDSVMTNAKILSRLGYGGTNCSAPLARLNERRESPDLVVFVSDNESWVDSGNQRQGTAMMREWEKLKTRNPSAKLVCIDIQPSRTQQAVSRRDILNIGGFSDAVFSTVAEFANNPIDRDHWIKVIEDVQIP